MALGLGAVARPVIANEEGKRGGFHIAEFDEKLPPRWPDQIEEHMDHVVISEQDYEENRKMTIYIRNRIVLTD